MESCKFSVKRAIQSNNLKLIAEFLAEAEIQYSTEEAKKRVQELEKALYKDTLLGLSGNGVSVTYNEFPQKGWLFTQPVRFTFTIGVK